MPQLDPQMADTLAMLARRYPDAPPLSSLTPAAARAQAEALNRALWRADAPTVTLVENRTLPGPAGPIGVRLYDPGVEAPAPGLVYIHGGGWVICSLDTHDNICRRLALAGRMRVASIDYRLAPEAPFPAPVEDCAAAARWFLERGAEWGFDPQRIAVGGDSAGGNLTLAASLWLRDRGLPQPRFLALLHPALSTDLGSPSHQAYGGGEYFLTTADMAWFWNHYLPDPAMRQNPLAVPLHADLRGLPPMLVTAAEFDPLRDDAERLVARLAEAGHPHEYHLWRGLTHACLHMTSSIDQSVRILQDTGALIAGKLRAPAA